MSNIPNNGENDQSLRDDLDRLGEAYGQLRREEPPELLDQAILNSARRAVEKKPRWMQFGWLHGLTTAAVFVLALSLVFHQREQIPVYEDGARLDNSMGLQRERAATKRPLETKTGDFIMNTKKESVKSRDLSRGTPVSAPGPDEDVEAFAGDLAPEPASDNLLEAYESEDLRATTDSIDKDITINELAVEEVLVDEAGLAADTPEITDERKQPRAAAVSAAPAAEFKVPVEDVDEIEQQLLAIMKMKASGDETWLTELALFKQKYPDYPLPDDLSN